MKNFAKALVDIVLSVLALYVFVFFIWLLMALGCAQYEDSHKTGSNCGQDEFTKIVRVVYSPIITGLEKIK
jgi:hypothetical protein